MNSCPKWVKQDMLKQEISLREKVLHDLSFYGFYKGKSAETDEGLIHNAEMAERLRVLRQELEELKKFLPDNLVQIKDIRETPCELFNPDDELVGIIESSLVLNDVRLQINRQNLSGYYVVFNGMKINIDNNGRLEEWPDGFFDIIENQLRELILG
jgi:hypothetical protein